MIEDPFSSGVHSMARSCRAAVELVRGGRWTLDDIDRWLKAVIDNDDQILSETRSTIVENLNAER